jgi:hypothetical protein
VREMSSKLIMGFVVEALDGRILDGAVHALDLTIGPRVLGLGPAVIDVVASARYFKSRSPEWLAALKHAFDISDGPTLAQTRNLPQRVPLCGAARSAACKTSTIGWVT